MSLTITGLPQGATLSAGTDNGAGTVTFDAADLAALAAPGAAPLTLTPAPNFSGPIPLNVTAVSTESDGSTAETSGSITVAVTPVADAPTLDLDSAGDGAPSGPEDGGAITLDLAAAVSDPSEALSLTITGLPQGATLSAGTDNGAGTVTFDAADLAALAAPGAAPLTLTPAPNFSGPIPLNVTAVSTESDGSTAETSGSITVAVTPVADAPTLDLDSAGDGAPSGPEDGGAITLDLAAAVSDPSEALSLTITGLPQGATLSAGTDNGAGTVTFDAADLAALAAPGAAPLTLTPAPNFSGPIPLMDAPTAVPRTAARSPSTSPPRSAIPRRP